MVDSSFFNPGLPVTERCGARSPRARRVAPLALVWAVCRRVISASIYKFYRLNFFSERLSDSYSLFTRSGRFYSSCCCTSGEITC